MRRTIGVRPLAAKLALGGALFAALGGVAYAASGGALVAPDGSIGGCAPPNGGPVHIWKPGHRCSGGWASVTFAPRGQSGPAGSTGATGATGATGPSNPSATTVDGETVTKLSLRVATPGSSTTTDTLYSGGGLTILAECDSSGNAILQANGPASADSELTVNGYDSGGTPNFGSQTNTLGPASLAALGPAGSGETSFSYASSSGVVITGTLGYQKAPSFGSYGGCGFFGTLVSG